MILKKEMQYPSIYSIIEQMNTYQFNTHPNPMEK